MSALATELGYALGIAGTATQATIRDRIYDLLEAFDPTTESRTHLRRSQNQDAGDFVAECEAHPAGCLRRFQVEDSADTGAEYSNTDADMRHTIMTIRVAYPHSQRFGQGGSMSRRAVMEQDFGEIEKFVGIYGRGWFFSTHDCTPLGVLEPQFEVERNATFDMLVIRARFSYWREVTPIA